MLLPFASSAVWAQKQQSPHSASPEGSKPWGWLDSLTWSFQLCPPPRGLHSLPELWDRAGHWCPRGGLDLSVGCSWAECCLIQTSVTKHGASQVVSLSNQIHSLLTSMIDCTWLVAPETWWNPYEVQQALRPLPLPLLVLPCIQRRRAPWGRKRNWESTSGQVRPCCCTASRWTCLVPRRGDALCTWKFQVDAEEKNLGSVGI